MFDHYAINVSQWVSLGGQGRYSHVFSTSPHSLRDREKALEVLTTIRTRFPKEEGFTVAMTHWVCRGHEVAE